ncbi:Farnesyltranstransferase [Rhodotorula toruloides ATCC 204091]|nr:Farnesyltranstransferase [Rhodotorula toruloides ATCC 204091]
MSLDWYDNFIDKVQGTPSWQPAQEQVLTEPYTYLASIPGKEVRSALIAAFNQWMGVADVDLEIVKKVVGMLHTASLLCAIETPSLSSYPGMDDVEDDSHLRRGMPGQSPISEPPPVAETDPVYRRTVAHKIYGIPQTINSANYVYFLAFQELQRIHPRPGIKVEEMVTGMDLFWRENLICPTEPEYIDMVNNKTGGLFRIAIKLMMAASPAPPRDYVPLANLIGIIFQIRDDYVNLQSVEVRFALIMGCSNANGSVAQYANNKGYCEDFSEGKFSFPIVHSIRSDTSNRQILNILRERPSSPGPKEYAVSYMETRTGSFAYTREVLRKLTQQARDEVARLGGNRGVEAILDKLVLEEPQVKVNGVEGEAMERKLEEVVKSKPVKAVTNGVNGVHAHALPKA